MLSSKNKKNNVYLSKPQFYYIKVGFKGANIIQACLRDDTRQFNNKPLPALYDIEINNLLRLFCKILWLQTVNKKSKPPKYFTQETDLYNFFLQ